MAQPDPQRLSRALRELVAAPLSAKLGLLIIVVYIFVAVFAPWIAPYGESEIIGKKYMAWDDEFLLGTDHSGTGHVNPTDIRGP